MDEANQKTNSSQQWLLIIVVCIVGVAAVFMAYNAGTKKSVQSVPISSPTVSSTKNILSNMILIPAGEFIMGSDDVDASGKSQEFGFNEPLYLNEHPQRTIKLKAF